MKRPFSHRLVVVIATGGYLGYIGPAPGTLGSLLGLFLLWPLSPGTTQVLVTLVLIGVGLVVAGRAAKVMGAQDPSAIIIDEIAGIAVATALLPPRVLERAVAFVLFRLFDITKPFPARQLERLSGGLGIVGDDLIAGLYANLLVQVWLFIS
ncbi:MAG: phosphatidylglycerophosphatase A [candidate division NC10 bacterium]|jgi:phosphatidylglycerophosphatase A|nr:phosphatidylglycerophosphatase A [candidate division NC10 bacterium]MCH7896527.1 phosphatidylglycerophosphatase A [candidate division NC10 bacterium]MCZ6550994.1 phosphatidylglycerophosphatase A [candidate division NC10 bacterium]